MLIVPAVLPSLANAQLPIPTDVTVRLARVGKVAKKHVGRIDATVLIALADELTETKERKVDAIFLAIERQQKVTVAKLAYVVVVEEQTKNWRGSVNLHATVPCEALFTVDLRQVTMRWDPALKRLYIAAPDPQVESVEVMTEQRQVQTDYTRGRFSWYDGDKQDGLLVAALDEVRAKAKEKAPEELARIGWAKEQLAHLFQDLWRTVEPDLIVVVE